jgi:hypothetical protein
VIKFLLDENVHLSIGVFLRDMGFDVVHAKEVEMLGASDDLIMELALRRFCLRRRGNWAIGSPYCRKDEPAFL